MDSGGAGEVNMCSAYKDSEEDGELSKREEDQEEEEEEEEEEKETNALLTLTVNGGLTGKRQKSSRRQVQWNDCNGKKLADVIEFEPSDQSDSEDEYGDSCFCNII